MSKKTDLGVLVDGLRRDRRRGPHAGHRAYADTAWSVHGAAEEMVERGEAGEAVRQLRKAVDRGTRALM
ncbi:hypothetical protein [Streptomyces minutiscleroticus]|uniref:hypothetical protein n=1 Tax=Streptomyces minutiscleroticus TaxID=68238 RepID=UPI0033307726